MRLTHHLIWLSAIALIGCASLPPSTPPSITILSEHWKSGGQWTEFTNLVLHIPQRASSNVVVAYLGQPASITQTWNDILWRYTPRQGSGHVRCLLYFAKDGAYRYWQPQINGNSYE
jgi:hypothetical protein